jgi:hypothetical protein
MNTAWIGAPSVTIGRDGSPGSSNDAAKRELQRAKASGVAGGASSLVPAVQSALGSRTQAGLGERHLGRRDAGGVDVHVRAGVQQIANDVGEQLDRRLDQRSERVEQADQDRRQRLEERLDQVEQRDDHLDRRRDDRDELIDAGQRRQRQRSPAQVVGPGLGHGRHRRHRRGDRRRLLEGGRQLGAAHLERGLQLGEIGGGHSAWLARAPRARRGLGLLERLAELGDLAQALGVLRQPDRLGLQEQHAHALEALAQAGRIEGLPGRRHGPHPKGNRLTNPKYDQSTIGVIAAQVSSSGAVAGHGERVDGLADLGQHREVDGQAVAEHHRRDRG